MFEQSEEIFMSEEMSINLADLNTTLDKPELNHYKNIIVQAVQFFIKQIQAQQNTNWKPTPFSCNDSPAELAINQYYFDHFDSIDNLLVSEISDSLRHAFCSFAYGGLHQLFTRQENEMWYPEIILSRELKPNDISSLPDVVILYRGTDRSEFDTKNFGQSWTTKLEVAKDFAFRHYDSQPWFDASNRIVLQTTYLKSDVYFSNQSCEYEVVVNTSKLQTVQCVKFT